MDVRSIIRQRRIELDMTMKELGEKVGVSEATISRWESGHIENMKRDKIVLLAKALGVTPAVIMGWEDYEPEKDGYFLDDEARNLAQFLMDNPEYKVLFDTTRKVKPEDIEFIRQMIDRVNS